MATVQKRRNTSRVQVRRNGSSVSALFDTRAEAVALGIKIDARLLDGAAPETIKQEPAQPEAISAVSTKAIKEWRIRLTDNPVFLIEKPRKPGPRTQRVNAADRARLLEALGWDGVSEPTTSSQWVALAFALAIATAMRRGEILSLQWREIDFDRRIAYLDMTKNGAAREVPLSSAAIALLNSAPNRHENDWVIPVKAGYLDKLFHNARRAMNLLHIRFHDSRREAASTMASKFSVLELSAITGHKSLQMLKIYYAANASGLAARLDA